MKTKSIYEVSLLAIMLSLMIVGSKITIPFPFIPLTLQTFMVILIPSVLGKKKGLIIMFTYIVLGLIGVPVFSSGGGISYIFSPSFGFIIGFLIAQIIISNNKNNYINILSIGISLIVIYLIGMVYMYFILKYYLLINTSIIYCFSVGVLPFIIKDSVSAILSYVVSKRISKALRFNYNDSIVSNI